MDRMGRIFCCMLLTLTMQCNTTKKAPSTEPGATPAAEAKAPDGSGTDSASGSTDSEISPGSHKTSKASITIKVEMIKVKNNKAEAASFYSKHGLTVPEKGKYATKTFYLYSEDATPYLFKSKETSKQEATNYPLLEVDFSNYQAGAKKSTACTFRINYMSGKKEKTNTATTNDLKLNLSESKQLKTNTKEFLCSPLTSSWSTDFQFNFYYIGNNFKGDMGFAQPNATPAP